jgi:hypothetical protein
MSLYQLQYSIKGALPTAAELRQIRDKWIRSGITPPGVRITPKCWNGETSNIREDIAAIYKPHIGRAGVVKCYASPFWTFCDYDVKSPPGLGRFWSFARVTKMKPRVVRYDRTARGWHVLIAWDRLLSPAETVAIQTALGSDYRRETYNLARVLAGGGDDPRWNLLFDFKIR